MRTRATCISIVLLVITAALLIPRSSPAAALAQIGDGAQNEYLGDGRYRAVIPALAGTYDQQPYIDTYVDPITPGSSYCTSGTLAVAYFSDEFGLHRQRTLIGFHLSSIPADAVVTSARLYLYLFEAWGRSSVTIYARRVTSAWDCPLYWADLPSSTGYTSQSVSTKPGWCTWDMSGVVENYWLGRNFGVSPNYGLELRGPESGTVDYHTRHFRSLNAASNRPHLVVEYVIPTPTRTTTRTPTTCTR